MSDIEYDTERLRSALQDTIYPDLYEDTLTDTLGLSPERVRAAADNATDIERDGNRYELIE